MLMFSRLLKFLFCLLVLVSQAYADSIDAAKEFLGGELASCDPSVAVIDVDSRLAKASLISNFFAGKGSLNIEIKELAQKGKKEITQITPPACISSCEGELTKKVKFVVIPNKLKDEYKEFTVCAEHLKQTQAEPIQIAKSDLSNIEDFSKWFSDSAQGKGEDGKLLYKECPGSCSPRYNVLLDFKPGDKFDSDSSIECGHARDKSDNMYNVQLKYLWTCRNPKPGPKSKNTAS